jgi:5-methylthioadenosine/S-adenosylhomocysteine deaminase
MDPEVLPARQALEMATIVGARALGLDKEIGSLEPGKRADLIVLRMDQPRAAPIYNVYSLLVYSLRATDVSDVMVNGRQIVRKRGVATLDARRIFSRAKELQVQISASLSK